MAIIKLPNPGMLKGIFDAIFNGGETMLYKESLQYQIDRAGERTWNRPLIKGWVGANGKKYDTSPLQQLAFNAQGIQRVESEVAAIKGLLTQIAQAANKGVAVDIDYDKIAAMMPQVPEYKLIPVEDTK